MVNHEIMIKEYLEYKEIIEMDDNEKMKFIHMLSCFSDQSSYEDIDISTIESAKQAIRGKVIIKKNQNFSMLYGDVAILLSGAMYTYFYDVTDNLNKFRVNCLLHKKIYGSTDVPILPNNSYLRSLKSEFSFKEFVDQSNKDSQVWEICAKSVADTELILINLNEIYKNKAVQIALAHYYDEHTRISDQLKAIKEEIINTKSRYPLYKAYPQIYIDYTHDVLSNFFSIPKTTWFRYPEKCRISSIWE